MLAFRKMYEAVSMGTTDEQVKFQLERVHGFVAAGRTFDALKVVRTLFEATGTSAPAEPAIASGKAA